MNNTQEYILALLRDEEATVPNDINWEEFLQSAYDEGISGVLHDKGLYPEDIKRKLENEYLTNMGRNILINEYLEEICQCFEENQVKAVIVRGATFFNSIYRDIGMRPLIDMDFVINKEDFSKVLSLLKEKGYAYNECYPYFIFKDDIYVDIHLESINFWRIKDWPSAVNIHNEKMMIHSYAFRGYEYVRELSVYDSILHCCEHLLRHSFDRLIWFKDIAQLINQNKESFDWDFFLARAQEFNIQKPVCYIISFLHEMKFINVAPDVLKKIQNVSLNFIERKNFKLLLVNERRNLSGDLLSLFVIPTWRQRLTVLWNGIFIPEDKFPLIREKLTPMAYVKRFFRLVGLVIKKTFTMLRPAKQLKSKAV